MDGLDGERQAKWFSEIRRHMDTYAFWRIITVGVNKEANRLFTELCVADKDKSAKSPSKFAD